MRLTIATPDAVVATHADIASLRVEDASGAFGIHPGHTDFLTALAISVLSWLHQDGRIGYCAVHGGVFRVSGGNDIAVATRRALLGSDLAVLEAEVRAQRQEAATAEHTEHGQTAALQVETIRRILGITQMRDGVGGHMP